jgi:hypothetical protein
MRCPNPIVWLDFVRDLIPTRREVLSSLKVVAMVALGGVILSPLVNELPMVGWDWYFVFYGSAQRMSAYPPYAKWILDTLTWMDWRRSLSLLNAISLMTISIATWRQGGRYGSIVLALLNAPVFFVMWIGHPDVLGLLGVITGFIPLALIKPQVTVWYFLKDRRSQVWLMLFLFASVVVWPLWPLNLRSATITHVAAYGWTVLGWPVALVGVILLLGAGNDPFRLMASGSLISPYIMPYHVAVLVPVLGRIPGAKKIVVWSAMWLMLLGVGIGGKAKYLNLVFPLSAYLLNHSFDGYKNSLRHNFLVVRRFINPEQ